MTWLKPLLIFSLLCLASGCVSGGFRHYDKISNCLVRQELIPGDDATGEKAYWSIWFSCHDAENKPFILTAGDSRINKLLSFDETEFLSHESACHAK